MVSKLRKSIFAVVMIFLCSAQAMGAEDTLRSLQQDVLLAKEKSAEISGQMDSVNDALDDDMVNRRWIMTTRGLKCIDCKGLDIVEEPETPPAPPAPPVTAGNTETKKYFFPHLVTL